jgi:hypothetical protein
MQTAARSSMAAQGVQDALRNMQSMRHLGPAAATCCPAKARRCVMPHTPSVNCSCLWHCHAVCVAESMCPGLSSAVLVDVA